MRLEKKNLSFLYLHHWSQFNSLTSDYNLAIDFNYNSMLKFLMISVKVKRSEMEKKKSEIYEI